MNFYKAVRFFPVIFLSLTLTPSSYAISLADISTDAQTNNGFIEVITSKKDGKVYLKIDKLNEEFIYQTSLPYGLGSNDIGLDRGQLGNTSLVIFEPAGNKLLLKQKPTRYRAVSDNVNEASSVEQAFASSVLWGFEIEDSGKEAGTSWVLVDATHFLLQDIHGVGRTLTETKQGKSYKVDESRSAPDFPSIKAFPDNTELQAIVTLTGSEPGDFLKESAPNPYSVTLKMRHSFIRLPEPGYKTRVFLPKSGYFAMHFKDYAQPINQPIEQKIIRRHRLEKQDPGAELSEAIEPIIYYLDSGAPEPVRSALLDGARWWNQAFEAIGYKDAFQVKTLPASADPMDVRYNVIQWVHRATRGWSYGSSVLDPRTGEIIKGHVTLGSLRVRQDYLIAQGMMAPFASDENDQALQDLALARIRQLSAHEIGHTLGIAHNFAASNYGRESVMDYPHPLFELHPTEADKIIAPNAYATGMGKWDLAAVAYGYQEFDENEELRALKNLIAQNDANGLMYISDADSRSTASAHAYSSLWDNGENPAEELERMMVLRETALANFGLDNLNEGRPFSDLEEILVPVYLFHRYQTTAAAKILGGITYDYSSKTKEDFGAQVLHVNADQQNQALATLIKTLSSEFLTLDSSITNLLPPKAAGSYRTRESVNGNTNVGFDSLSLAASSAQHTLNALLHPQRLARLNLQNAADPEIPTLIEIANELRDQIINQTQDTEAMLVHHTVIDLIYSNYHNLSKNLSINGALSAQIAAVTDLEREFLSKQIRKAKSSAYKGLWLSQLQKLNHDSDNMIDLPSIPPGSPI